MKTTLLTLIALAITVFSFGQAPEAFKYQAVVRDAGGAILTNQSVGYQLSIVQGSPAGTAVYTETFSPTTNNYGLVNIEIGTGTTVDDFTAIDWANGPFYIETSVDVTGGTSYAVMGTSQLVSVPYALYAKSAENVTNDQVDDADADPTNELQDISLTGTDLTISSGSTVDLSVIQDGVNDADADPNNELQAVSFSNDTLYLSNGGQVYLGAYGIDLVDDADADPNNELQSLSYSNDTLYLSNSNSVHLVKTINMVKFDTPGANTFTVPDNVHSIIVEAWGAGGGTGDVNSNRFAAGYSSAGGGGAYVRSVVQVVPGTTYNLYVANSTDAGYDGESSTFGPNIVVAGGGLHGRSAISADWGITFYNGEVLGGKGGSNFNSVGDLIVSGSRGGTYDCWLAGQIGNSVDYWFPRFPRGGSSAFGDQGSDGGHATTVNGTFGAGGMGRFAAGNNLAEALRGSQGLIVITY